MRRQAWAGGYREGIQQRLRAGTAQRRGRRRGSGNGTGLQGTAPSAKVRRLSASDSVTAVWVQPESSGSGATLVLISPGHARACSALIARLACVWCQIQFGCDQTRSKSQFVLAGCAHRLTDVTQDVVFADLAFSAEVGGTSAQIFRTHHPRSRTGRAVVKVFCMPHGKVDARGERMPRPSCSLQSNTVRRCA